MTTPPCNCPQALALQAALDICERDTLVKVARALRDNGMDANDVFGIIEIASGSTRTAAAVMRAIGEDP